MQPERPPKNATVDQIVELMYQEHICREEQHAEMMAGVAAAKEAAQEAAAARGKIADKLHLDRNINIVGLILLIVTVLSSYAYAINTLRDIQESQKATATLGVGRDGKIGNLEAHVGSIDAKIGVLCDIAVTNHEALIGPNKSGRNCR